MSRRTVIVAVALLLAGGTSCSHGTELVLEITVGPGVDAAEIDSVRVAVTEAGETTERFYYIQDQLLDGSTSISIRPGDLATTVIVEVAAFSDGFLLAAAGPASVEIQSGEAAFYTLALAPAADPNCPLSPWSSPLPVSGVNSPAEDSSPFVTADGLTIYFASERTGDMELYTATRASPLDSFGAVSPLAELNSASLELYPWVTADGLTIYYCSGVAGNGVSDLWVATRGTNSGPFSNPGLMATVSDPGEDDYGPWLSPDGLTLWFSSSRWSDLDIATATRSSTSEPFGNVDALSEFFTGSYETAPSLLPDQRTIFYASDLSGEGGMDIFAATRTSTSSSFDFRESVPGINTSFQEWDPSISPDGRTLYFSSDRPGGSGDFDIWVTTRSCE